MFLYDNCATRLENFLDVFGICGDGEVLEAVMILVPARNGVASAVLVVLFHDLGEPVFDVNSRPLVLVIRTGKNTINYKL